MSVAGYSPPPLACAAPHTITPWSPEAIGAQLTAVASAPATGTGTVSNLVIYVPFQLAAPFTVVEVGWLVGSVVGNGNAQVGVYSNASAQLVECTATTTAGTTDQTLDVTDTLLIPGRYYMAFRASSATDRFVRSVPANVLLASCGVCSQASQADLPATATMIVTATAYMPFFYIAGHTLL